ncbi:MAG TPA: YciI family protein [Asanoa sp.]|nr:YciI family protein [Asanoa sp.]
MKVIVMIKGTGADEDKVAPTREMLTIMGEYNDKLIKAGILLDAAGLRPSSEAKQVVLEGGTTSVVDGPFTESKEIVAGYWIWQVDSMEEAVEWARQCPIDPLLGRGLLEIRPYWDETQIEALPA